jgi:hypothetical protein
MYSDNAGLGKRSEIISLELKHILHPSIFYEAKPRFELDLLSNCLVQTEELMMILKSIIEKKEGRLKEA